MKVGVHLWTGEGLKKTIEHCDYLKCDCFQIFLHSPRKWERKRRGKKEVEEFKKELSKRKIHPFVVHMPYLINLASPYKNVRYNSLKLLEREIEEAEITGAHFYVIHPGSHKGDGKKNGWRRVCGGLKKIVGSKTKILIENTAGQGNSLGEKLEEFKVLIDCFGDKIGFCIDTAHLFQAGYNFKEKEGFYEMKEEIEKNLSLGYILLIHANDSATACGSKIDRHQHIGKGYIGMEGFEKFIKDEYFGNLPFIIETPKESLKQDKKNIEVLRKIGVHYGKI